MFEYVKLLKKHDHECICIILIINQSYAILENV